MNEKKDVWKPITDPALALQIQARKWREDWPTWQIHDGVVWVLKEQSEGKISGTSQAKVP